VARRGEGPLYFALFRLSETREVGYRDELARMMGEGIAKKEMARRFGNTTSSSRRLQGAA